MAKPPARIPVQDTPYPEAKDRIRLTISVSPEVHATFQRMAEAGSMSISRAMGDWLQDTLEAADYTASLMERARAAPKQVMREVHSFALGLVDETGSLMDSLRRKGLEASTRAEPGAVPPAPPSSNTGGKVPRENPGKGRK